MRIGRTLHASSDDHVAGFARDEAGVSAIEFGLVAPLIFFSFLAMTDVGFALRDRIALDHLLRSGAQVAMRDGGAGAVLHALENSACKTGEVHPACEELTLITFGVDRYCLCPPTAKDITCSVTCAVQPQKFYELSAAKSYEGIFLPRFDFAPSVLVEVR